MFERRKKVLETKVIGAGSEALNVMGNRRELRWRGGPDKVARVMMPEAFQGLERRPPQPNREALGG